MLVRAMLRHFLMDFPMEFLLAYANTD